MALRLIDQEQDDNYSADQVAGLDLHGLYQKADKALGGWLPGGGTGNPLSKPLQQTTQRVKQAAQQATTAPRAAAGALRDLAIVPAIDKGIETGVIPAAPGMFVRYLSGTSKPMEAYPEKNKEAINSALPDLMIASTKEKVDSIFNTTDPGQVSLERARASLYSYQRELRDQAEMTGREPTAAELAKLQKLESNLNGLMSQLGVTKFTEKGPSREQRLEIIKKNRLAELANMTVDSAGAYGGNLPDDVWKSLGRFEIRNGTVVDQYKFDDLRLGRRPTSDGSVYPDAAGGGKTASDLIELALHLGLITPESGYDVRIPLSKRRRQGR